MRREQKNFTVTPEQLKIIKKYHGKIPLKQLSQKLGLNYGKVQNNVRLLGLVKPLQARVIEFDRNGYFDEDKFARYYSY